MTSFILLLAGLQLLGRTVAQEKWSWNNDGQGRYTVAKTLVALREPPKQPLFLSSIDSNNFRNKARYEVSEDGDRGLSAFLERPVGPNDDRPPFLGSNAGLDRSRPGIDRPRPGFPQGRPDFISPDFGSDGRRPAFGVARPVPPERPFGNRPVFIRPGSEGDRYGPVGNRPGPGFGTTDFIGDRPEPRPDRRPNGGKAPGILTGPVASWEKNPGRPNRDPTEFDTCKCKHGFNCKSPGIRFGACDVGKQYCCYDSTKYGLERGGRDGRRPLLIGPSDLEPRDLH